MVCPGDRGMTPLWGAEFVSRGKVGSWLGSHHSQPCSRPEPISSPHMSHSLVLSWLWITSSLLVRRGPSRAQDLRSECRPSWFGVRRVCLSGVALDGRGERRDSIKADAVRFSTGPAGVSWSSDRLYSEGDVVTSTEGQWRLMPVCDVHAVPTCTRVRRTLLVPAVMGDPRSPLRRRGVGPSNRCSLVRGSMGGVDR